MNYNKIFKQIAHECRDSRALVIIGLLQSIRDNCPIDTTTKEEMLKLCYFPKNECIDYNTLNYTKIDTK